MKHFYFGFLFFVFSISLFSQTVIHSYSFEDNGASSYTTSVTEFSDGGYDFFTSTFNNAIASNYGVNGQHGTHYFAAQDMDGDGQTVPQSLSMNFDIIGHTGLALRLLVAEDDFNDPKWDSSDYVHIDYSIDGGASSPLLWFESEGGTNSETKVDSNYDGIGDSETITEEFMELEKAISGTGSSLTITFTFNLDSGQEDFAIDNVRILEGYVVDTTPSLEISSPSDNSIIYETSLDVSLILDNFTVGNSGAEDGHIHYSLDGGTEVMKYDTNPISLSGLSYGSHTLVVSLVDNLHNQLSSPVQQTLNFSVVNPIATLPFYEGFDYTFNSALNGSGKWQSMNSGDDILIIDSSLTYAGDSSTNGKISFSGGGKESKIELNNTGSTYVSFWLNVSDISSITDSDGGYFASLNSNDTYESKIWLKPSTNPIGTTYNLSFSSLGSNPTYISEDMNVNETYLIVMSYNDTTGEINGWINPPSASATPKMTSIDSSPKSITSFILRQDSSSETPSLEIDELRIDSAFAGVLHTMEQSSSRVSIYPNPISTDIVFISGMEGSKKAVLHDLTGRVVLKTTVNNQLNIAGVKTGVYLLELAIGDKKSTKKLIVK